MSIDYTKFNTGDKPKVADEKMATRWWLLPVEEMPQAIAKTLNYIQQRQGNLETQRQTSNRLYSNSSLSNINGLTFTKNTTANLATRERITFNVVQSVIDTIVAKMAKNKPKPLFLTSGGDYKMQSKAKKLDKFVDGIFYENKTYDLGLESLRKAAVGGTGIVHVYPFHGRVKMEEVFASELYVDEFESFYGKPRQMHRVKNVDRAVLKEMFPEHATAIDECNDASSSALQSFDSVGDMVSVAESWHLPSGPDAEDGLHIISISDQVLFSEDWEVEIFPFAFLHYTKRLHGFWGQGAAERLQAIQLEVNKLLWVIQRSMHLSGSFKILMENGSKIVKEHLNNDIGAIINYTGAAPQYITPPIVPQEIYAHLTTLKNSAYEQEGVSQLSASAVKPAGLDSGKALREYNDIESDRFTVLGKAYEQFYLDLATLAINCAKTLYGEDGDFEVKVPGKKFIETIKWREVDLEDDEYIMKIYPISSLPQDPAGRLQTIQEYIQSGMIDPMTGKRLLDFPDLEAVETLSNSIAERIQKILEDMVEEGIYTPPDPFMDLQLARTMTLQYLNKGMIQNLEEERLELLRTFIGQLDALVMQSQPPAMPGAPTPQANPEAAPVSDLIPNVPQV